MVAIIDTLLIISILLFIVILTINFYPTQENLINYYQCNTVPTTKAIKDIFSSSDIQLTDKPENAELYQLCNFDNGDSELNSINKYSNIKYVNGVKNMDSFVSKAGLYNLLENYYGKDKANILIPKTWLINGEITSVFKEPDASIFIAKKDIQQQIGIKLLKKEELTISLLAKLKNERYVVLQEYLKSPFIIDSRKINMRVYILIIVNSEEQPKVYMYNDGFIYYTKKAYSYTADNDAGITSGFQSREVYKSNPLTHKDFRTYLIKNGVDHIKLFNNIKDNISKVFKACIKSLHSKKGITQFQIFGVDVAPDKDLNIKFIECNKNPSLDFKDQRDGELKTQMQKDAYKLVGLSGVKTVGGFIEIV